MFNYKSSSTIIIIIMKQGEHNRILYNLSRHSDYKRQCCIMLSFSRINLIEFQNHYHLNKYLINRLQQLWGNYIVFDSEGEENDTWCGRQGRSCLSCFSSTVGYSDDDACSSRLVTPALAASLTRLAKYVEAEWPDSMYDVTLLYILR